MVGGAFAAIDKYNVGDAAREMETVKVAFNGKLFPITPPTQKPNLLMNHVFNASQGDARTLGDEFWNTVAANPLRLGVVLGAPGSGKTSALMEYLGDHFGLYFLAKPSDHGGKAVGPWNAGGRWNGTAPHSSTNSREECVLGRDHENTLNRVSHR